MLARAILFAACLILAAVTCSPAQAQCSGNQCSARSRVAHFFAPQAHQTVSQASDDGWYPGKRLAERRQSRRGN